jgi:hypothetical protein
MKWLFEKITSDFRLGERYKTSLLQIPICLVYLMYTFCLVVGMYPFVDIRLSRVAGRCQLHAILKTVHSKHVHLHLHIPLMSE